MKGGDDERTEGVVLPRTWLDSPGEHDVRSIDRVLDEYGAVCVRGCSEQDFVRLSDQLGEGFIVHGSPLRTATPLGPTIKTVDAGNHAIALHSEMAYLPVHIERLFFYCVRPPRAGGQTVLADGVALARRLSPFVRGQLDRQRLRYRLRIPRALWPLVAAVTRDVVLDPRESFVIHGEEDERVLCEYLTPALRRRAPGADDAFCNAVFTALDSTNEVARQFYRLTLEDGRPLPVELVDELRRAGAAVAFARPWRRGDLWMVDNQRFLHGRRAFEGAREILTRFARRRRSPAGGSAR